MDLILILGGTNSGKTGLAEQLALRAEKEQYMDVRYFATATAGDSEMARRIEAHRSKRPSGWTTIEEPLAINRALEGLCRPAFILFDCLTLWLTNQIMTLPDERLNRQTAEDLIYPLLQEFLAEMTMKEGTCCIVSNLVEEGLLSPYKMGRVYQDLAGGSHQILAGAASSVYHVRAGLPVKIKG